MSTFPYPSEIQPKIMMTVFKAERRIVFENLDKAAVQRRGTLAALLQSGLDVLDGKKVSVIDPERFIELTGGMLTEKPGAS